MHFLVAGASGGALTAVAGDPVPHLAEPGQLFGVEMDHVARLLPLVPLHRSLGLEVPQQPEPKGFHDPSDRGEGSAYGLGDLPERCDHLSGIEPVTCRRYGG